MGMIDNPRPLMEQLQRMRKSADINYETEVWHRTSENSLYILTDAGRCLSPYLTVEDGKQVMTAGNLITRGYQRYLQV